MTMVFDTLRFSQRLQQVGITRDQAEAHAELARDMIIAELVTKNDLVASVRDLQAEMKLQEQRITIRLGAMLVAAVGVIVTAQKLLG